MGFQTGLPVWMLLTCRCGTGQGLLLGTSCCARAGCVSLPSCRQVHAVQELVNELKNAQQRDEGLRVQAADLARLLLDAQGVGKVRLPLFCALLVQDNVPGSQIRCSDESTWLQDQKVLVGLICGHAIRLEGSCSGNEQGLLTADELKVCFTPFQSP